MPGMPCCFKLPKSGVARGIRLSASPDLPWASLLRDLLRWPRLLFLPEVAPPNIATRRQPKVQALRNHEPKRLLRNE
eukprot:14529434-Alexandrium_andersonii.AAC.1